jgi:NAD(P)-dependent dehydrogenase (short-subunit alcohol dehydrogenase family)
MSEVKRNAVVTGGAKGIGLAIAQSFASKGMGVAIWGRNGEDARRAADEINAAGGRAVGCEVDVARVADIEAAAKRTTAELGALTVLINNAGIAPFMPMSEHTEEIYDYVVDVNLKGAFFCTRALAPQMMEAKFGRIINMSSLAAQLGAIQMTAYSASKAGLWGLTKSVAREFGPYGVTCNCLCPSAIRTPALEVNLADGYMPIEQIEAETMIGRIGTVDEMAALCDYLVSDQAGFVTGQIIGVNGGKYV